MKNLKRKVDVLVNNKGELALSYKEGGVFSELKIHRNIREERHSKGWTSLNVSSSNQGWKKISSFVENVSK